jgi:glycosyltransferase involved in cell wall biosynthesis
MDRITLSVAMCTYNGEAYLPEQLISIAAQTRQPDELVICDDCSSDGTVEIVKEFASHAPFVVRLLQNNENLGSTKNFAKAFGNCRFDVIAPSDQDDFWYPDKLQSMEEVFIKNADAGLVFSNADIVDKNLVPVGCTLWKSVDFNSRLQRQVDAGRAFNALLKYNFVTGATMAFPRRFLPLVLPIPELWVHDAWVAILLSVVTNVIRVDRSLIKYRQHSKQQLGLRRTGISAHITTAQARNSHSEYRRKLQQYLLVEQRLQEQKCFEIRDEIGGLLKNKLQHLDRRFRLPKGRFRRFPMIGRELLLHRYRDCGHGWRAAVRDMLVNLDDQ